MAKLVMRTAIRKRCLNCSGFSPTDVKDCDRKDCQLYPYRMGKNIKGKSADRAKAVRDYCTDCCNGSPYEKGRCSAVTCPLWEFRSGSRKNADE